MTVKLKAMVKMKVKISAEEVFVFVCNVCCFGMVSAVRSRTLSSQPMPDAAN